MISGDKRTRLPPIWLGFDSQTQRHTCVWVEFVVGSCPCSERLFSGYSRGAYHLHGKPGNSSWKIKWDASFHLE